MLIALGAIVLAIIATVRVARLERELGVLRKRLDAAAAGFVLVLMTLAMNGLAIWLRYRLRRNLKW